MLFVTDSIQLMQGIPYKKAPEVYGDFRIGRQAIRTVKCEDDLVLMAMDKTVLLID